MNEPTQIPFKDVASFIRRYFPEAKSRRPVKVSVRKSYHVSDYWDGGSRNYAVFVNLRTGENVDPKQVQQLTEGHVYHLPYGSVELSEGFAVIEHCIFCGKDLGYRVYVGDKTILNENSVFANFMPKSLPEKI